MQTIHTSEHFARRTLNKAAWRLLPLLAAGYLFCYIDRINVGFAALTMNKALGLTATQFGLAAGMYFISYCLLEIPSNVVLHRVGARRWLPRIMITWGLAAAATALAVGPHSFAVLRLILGAFEAGFFPGVIYFITVWFPDGYRARVLAGFQMAIPLSTVISGPLSALVLQKMNGILGLAGWQWMFIVEGLPAVLLGLLALRILVDTPARAKWLSEEERGVLDGMLAAERPAGATKRSLLAVAGDIRVLLLAFAYFCLVGGSLGISIWLPQILRTHALSVTAVGLVSTLPFIAAAIGMLVWAIAVERTKRYFFHYVIALLIASGGFFLAVEFQSLLMAVLGITVALVGLNAARAPLFSLVPHDLTGAASASAIALISVVGNAGGFLSTYMVGWLKDVTGSFQSGILALSLLLIISAALVLCLGLLSRRRERLQPAAG